MPRYLIPLTALLIGVLHFSCDRAPVYRLTVDGPAPEQLFVTELITERVLDTLRLTDGVADWQPSGDRLSLVTISDSVKDYVGIIALDPSRKVTTEVRIDSASVRSSHHFDRAYQQLVADQMGFLQGIQGRIFGGESPESAVELVDSFRLEYAADLRSQSSLSTDERALLVSQLQARLYSFLFYYGRVVNGLPSSHTFYNFSDSLSLDGPYVRFLPQNVLYTHELRYLQMHDSIASMRSFTNYLREETEDSDLANFLAAVYVRDMIENPSYWRLQGNLLSESSIRTLSEEEAGNPYSYIFTGPMTAKLNTLSGRPAPDFTALTQEGASIELADFSGRYLLIDVWATWCGPCLQQKPDFWTLADNLAGEDQIAFLSISVDMARTTWIKYLPKVAPEGPLELWAGAESGNSFSEDYQITFLPRYILVGPNGQIVNPNVGQPSHAVEMQLRELLSSTSFE